MAKIIIILKKYSTISLTIFFSLLAFILFGTLSFHSNIWYDEAYQLILNENSFTQIIDYVAKDFHVPFYAVGLKIFTTILGATPLVGRLFSLLAIICCFILSFYKIKDLFSLKTSILFSTFLLSLSCIYYCSIEIRPYSWPMFFTLASTTYMIGILKGEGIKSWIFYTIFSVLAMYSHNIAMIYIFCSQILFLIYLLIKRKNQLKSYFISFFTSFLCYLPWLTTLLKQYGNLKSGFWIDKPELLSFLKESKILISRNEILVYILAILICFSIFYTIFKRKDKENTYCVFLNFVIAFAVCFLISKYKTPLLIPKYLVTFIGVFLLCISDFLTSIKSKIWIGVIILLLGINSIVNYQYETTLLSEKSQKQMLKYFEEEENLYFIHYTEFGLGEFRYYFPNAIHFIAPEIVSNLRDYELFGQNVIELNLIKDLENYNIDTIWTVNYFPAMESNLYFEDWNQIEYYEYVNTYYYGKHYLRKLTKN